MVVVMVKMGKRVCGDARMKLVVCGIVVMVIGNYLPLMSAQSECGDVGSINRECSRYIQRSGQKTPPSQQCCDALEGSDVNCLCNYLQPFEIIYSMEKIVYVLEQCQMPLASGTKCGSYTVP